MHTKGAIVKTWGLSLALMFSVALSACGGGGGSNSGGSSSLPAVTATATPTTSGSSTTPMLAGTYRGPTSDSVEGSGTLTMTIQQSSAASGAFTNEYQGGWQVSFPNAQYSGSGTFAGTNTMNPTNQAQFNLTETVPTPAPGSNSPGNCYSYNLTGTTNADGTQIQGTYSLACNTTNVVTNGSFTLTKQ